MMDCTQFADVSKMVDQEVPRMMDRTQFHRQLQHLTPAEIAPLDAMAGHPDTLKVVEIGADKPKRGRRQVK